MKLDDFLKCKKVRCLSNDYDFNEQGKAYKLHGLRVFITDETGCKAFLPIEDFEPVLEPAENPLQNIELTPEFETEASEPKFKAGDKVYIGLTGKIRKIDSFNSNDGGFTYSHNDITTHSKNKDIVKATQENYEMLCKLYPNIKFEQPPKELKGSDLCRAMLEKGWNLVPCVISQISDDEALLNDDVVFIDEWNGRQFEHGDRFCIFAVPFDPRTGEPLTESILND